MLNGFFVGASGGTTTRIQVYVEYTYEFELKTSGIITREPRAGNTITIPFRVFPTDLEITAQVSDPGKLEVKSVSLNTLTGEGNVEVTPLGEKNGLTVTISAVNPQDRINTPIIRTQYINLRYENLIITPVFDFEAGSFSYYDARTNTLYLGDGEQSLFHLNILEENAELENLQVFWQSVNGSTVDNKEVKNGGHISLAKESGTSNSGEPLWRIGHNTDHPYVLRNDVFKANPNYYRTGMSGSGSEGWWIFGDSDSADFPPKQYHQYATPTTSKNSAVIGTSYGQIKLTYKRYDGTTGEKIVNVQVQKRECEAYNNGKWREVSPGRWEQR
jgi:hypothetical protein